MIVMSLICITISVVFYIWLHMTNMKRSISQNVLILMMILSNLGYLSMSLSTDLSGAILSNKIIYLGGAFIPLLYFMTVCEVCHIPLKKRVTTPLVILQMGIFALICTMGYLGVYYQSQELAFGDAGPYLMKVYGPLHFIYPLSLYCYLGASLAMVIYATVRIKTVNRKELGLMIGCAAFNVLCYVFERLAGKGNAFTPVGYIVLMAGTLPSLYHSNLYSVDENRNVIKEAMEGVGYIIFNRKLHFMSCNDTAVSIFPELKKCTVGRSVNHAGSQLCDVLSELLTYSTAIGRYERCGHMHKNLKMMRIQDHCYDIVLHTANDFRGFRIGFMVELKDSTEHYRMMELQEQYSEKLSCEVTEKTKQIRFIQERTILGMAQMVESRDMSTGGHIRRTSDVVRIFAKKLQEVHFGLDTHFLELVARSAPMHDLGKIGVDDQILRKQGKFTDEEYEKMKKHAEIGGKMVRDILTGVEEERFVTIAHNVANYHHEKVNGRGYPEGLKGDAIPIEARIMALADVFDALVSKRCYKDAFSFDKAFSIIEEDAGEHFDYPLAMVFMKCRPELENYYRGLEE